MSRHIQRTVRLPLELDITLCKLASAQKSTPYAVLQHAVSIGLQAVTTENSAPQRIAEIAQELGSLSVHQSCTERLLERALYTACAAYVYSRATAAGRIDEAKILHEITCAYQRQLKLAEGEDA